MLRFVCFLFISLVYRSMLCFFCVCLGGGDAVVHFCVGGSVAIRVFMLFVVNVGVWFDADLCVCVCVRCCVSCVVCVSMLRFVCACMFSFRVVVLVGVL